MKRGLLLLALVTVVIWLAHGAPAVDKKQPNPESSIISPTAPQPQEDPCDEGCDPNGTLEFACIIAGGSWNPTSCYCNYSFCDPDGSQQFYCWISGGTWNSFTCSCSMSAPCNPGPEIATPADVHAEYEYCNGTYVLECRGTWTTYVRYCQDGSVYSQRTDYRETCVNLWEPCNTGGGGGGGGGGGYDCWADLDCWCPDHGDDPDCEDYCWWNYCEVENAN
jgi:hypothetical protein